MHYEQIFVEIVVFERGWVTMSANFRGVWRHPPKIVGVRKLGYHVALLAWSYV